ncbi:peptidylprolyl isomerase [Alsobacter sp. R-9]
MTATLDTSSSKPADCSVKPKIAAKPKTVSVNGVVIARAAIAQETQNHPASKPIEAWQAAARALVVRELLLQEARRLGLTPVPASDAEGRCETDEEALVRALVEREVKTPEAEEDACRRYWSFNRERFRTPDLYEVRHILLAADPSNARERAEAATRARVLIDDIRGNASKFAGLAEISSACPSRNCGGSLGQIGPGQTVAEFESALPDLPVGEVAPEPVETRFGFHVVWVDRRIAGCDLPFEAVRSRIAAWLSGYVWRTAVRQYITVLAGRAEISGVDLASSATPLVQ